MANLIPGICTQCGATLSVDAAKDCMICPYCGTPFIVEKAVQNFNTTYQITNNITAQNVYVQGSTDTGFKIVAGVLKAYTGEARDVKIPDNVVKIGYRAFANTMVQSIQIPNSVIEFGEGAFCGCKNLKSIAALDSVTTIGDSAFIGCTSLREISMPSVTTIESSAFADCTSLMEVAMPKVVTIGDSAFSGCTTLIEVSIPDVAMIGRKAFIDCTALKKVSASSNVQAEYCSHELPFIHCSKLYSVYLDGVELSVDAFDFPNWLEGSGIGDANQEKMLKQQRKIENHCQYCGGVFKFAFFGKPQCSVCGKQKDYDDYEL